MILMKNRVLFFILGVIKVQKLPFFDLKFGLEPN